MTLTLELLNSVGFYYAKFQCRYNHGLVLSRSRTHTCTKAS